MPGPGPSCAEVRASSLLGEAEALWSALRADQRSLLLLLLDGFVLSVLLLSLSRSLSRHTLRGRLDLGPPILELLLVSWAHVRMLRSRGIVQVFLRAQNQHLWVSIHVAFDIDDASLGAHIID